MKTKDLLWIIGILSFSMILVIPDTRVIFNELTTSHPYLMGFIKTAYLATMGEMLVSRMKHGVYFMGKKIWMKFLVWGLLGMVFVFIFKIFSSGVISAQQANLLPSMEGTGFLPVLLSAFLTSIMMNLFFAPTFMFLHQITDGYIDQSQGNLKKLIQIPLVNVIDRMDIKRFISFVVLKTIPLFWIPAHTITFLLPENYRILMAAYLSIALGILLTISNQIRHSTK
jgi:hypothetical protein